MRSGATRVQVRSLGRGLPLVGLWILAGDTACGRVGYDAVANLRDGAAPVEAAVPPVDGEGLDEDLPPERGADLAADAAPDLAPDRVPGIAADRPPADMAPVTPASCTEPGARTDPTTGHCYFMPSMSAMLWEDARVACDQGGAHLATLTSPAEQAFAVSVLSTEELWIGLYQIGTGPWQWVTGEQASYTAWAPLEPDEPSDGRARLSTDGWHDTDARRRFLALCERDP